MSTDRTCKYVSCQQFDMFHQPNIRMFCVYFCWCCFTSCVFERYFFLVLIRLNICKCAYWHRLWRVHQAVERGVADFRGNAMQKLHCILFSFEIKRHKERDSEKKGTRTHFAKTELSWKRTIHMNAVMWISRFKSFHF